MRIIDFRSDLCYARRSTAEESEQRAVFSSFMRFTLVFPRIVHFNIFTEDKYFFGSQQYL